MVNNSIMKEAKRKTAGFTLLEIFLYLLGMPLMVALTAVTAVRLYELMPYYTFWPFIGVILAGVLTIAFFITVAVVYRKKSKKSMMKRTITVIVVLLCLTFLIGALIDVVLPDILSSMTTDTLMVEDLENNYESQGETNALLVRKYIMFNMANGNYDPEYAYDTLKADILNSEGLTSQWYSSYYNQLGLIITRNSTESAQLAAYEELIAGLTDLHQELYEFIYENWVLRDAYYAFMSPTSGSYIGNVERKAVALAISRVMRNEYTTLCTSADGGMNNERIAELFEKNYASMHNDGYVNFDDNGILYAQSTMTVSVVISLLLGDATTISEGTRAYLDENNNLIYPTYDDGDGDDSTMAIGALYYEQYMSDSVVILFNYYNNVLVKVNNYDNTYYVDPSVYTDNEVSGILAGAVVEPYYRNGELIGGYVSQPAGWSVLDMDGNTMSVASLDLSSLLSSLSNDSFSLNDLLSTVLNISVPDEYGDSVGILEGLLDGINAILYDATAGRTVELGIYMDDSGVFQINIYPTNVTKGILGYQDMTWLQSNNLLVAVISVMSLRNWLYIIGAIALVTTVAACGCQEFKYRILKRAKEEIAKTQPALATETAGDAQAGVIYDEETGPQDVGNTTPLDEIGEQGTSDGVFDCDESPGGDGALDNEGEAVEPLEESVAEEDGEEALSSDDSSVGADEVSSEGESVVTGVNGAVEKQEELA